MEQKEIKEEKVTRARGVTRATKSPMDIGRIPPQAIDLEQAVLGAIMIDANALIKGKKYKELNDSFIIFICKHDPVGENLPVYTYLESCQEDKSLLLNDGTHKFFFNAAAADNEKDVEIRAFLNYIKNGKASDDFTNEIDSIVEAVKQNEAVKELYMMKSILIQDAESEGEKKATIKAVHGLYKNNVSIEVIAKSLEITEEQVKKYLEQSLPA